MKLSDITFKQSKEFEFLDPITNKSFEPKVFIEILSSDSKTATNNFLKAKREVLEKMQDENNLEDEQIKPELLEAINNTYLSTLIVSWENIDDFKKVTDANKLKLIQNEKIASFVIEKSNNLGNFKG